MFTLSECVHLHLWVSAGNDFFWSERSQICTLNRRHTWRWRSKEIVIPLLMEPVPVRHAIINCWKNVVPKIVSLKEAICIIVAPAVIDKWRECLPLTKRIYNKNGNECILWKNCW